MVVKRIGNDTKLGSLFDGIGGFPFAAVKVGITPVWASEIEAVPISITKRHFPEMLHLGDITKINGAEIEPVDIITFGSPCQDLSIAGRRAGLEGSRSSLFMEAIRIIKEMRSATNGIRPRFAVWENVPGTFSSNRGEDFRTVIEKIATIAKPGVSIPRPSSKTGWLAAGAIVGDSWSLAWRVLDAQYWGVPQRRDRIFLVADFREDCAGEILFRPESLSGYFAEGGTAWEKVTADATGSAGMAIQVNAQKMVWPETTGPLIARADSSPCIDRGQPFICEPQTVNFGSKGDRIQINADKAVTLQSGGGGGSAKTGLYCFPNNCYQETVGCLCGSDHKGIGNQYVNDDKCICVEKSRVRRLTPKECERLQGFLDGWTECGHDGKRISDTQRYKGLGNSVAIPCVVFVLSGIKEKL